VERFAERRHSEIFAFALRLGSIDAIEESGDVDELGAVLEEVAIDDFGAR
jgi:hypothetical protein